MSLQFLSQKSWHPANKANQKRIWVAEQNARVREKQEQEKAKEVRKAVDDLQVQQAAAVAGDAGAARRVASEQVNFLYAVPPGLLQAKEAAKQTPQMILEEDEAVREFRRKVESQRTLERYVGRKADETLTIQDQVERFPMLKDAPVEGKYTETIRVHFNPVGLRLRNVRCVRCGDWGHQSGDRECKRRDENPNDATRRRWEDPVTEINKLKSELVLRKGALPLGAESEEFEILQSDDDEVGDAFVAKLSTKQRKRLMKKLKKQSELDSDLSDHRCRSKKKTSTKHKRKRKHRSRNRSDDGSDSKVVASRRRDVSLSPDLFNTRQESKESQRRRF